MKNSCSGSATTRAIRNTQRHHRQRRRAVATRSARGDFSGSDDDPRSADRPAVPRQHHSRRTASARARAQLLDDFVPLPNSAGNRYIASPDAIDDRDQFGAAVRLPAHRATVAARRATCGATTDARHAARSTPADRQPARRDAAGRHGARTPTSSAANVINQSRAFSYQPDRRANPAVTSGLTNARLRHQRAATPTRWRAGLPSIAVTGLLHALGDAQQPFVEPRQRRLPVRRRLRPGCAAGTRSSSASTSAASTWSSRSSTGRTATSRSTARITGNAAADFLLGLPAQFRATTTQSRSRTATAGSTPATCRTSSASIAPRHR